MSILLQYFCQPSFYRVTDAHMCTGNTPFKIILMQLFIWVYQDAFCAMFYWCALAFLRTAHKEPRKKHLNITIYQYSFECVGVCFINTLMLWITMERDAKKWKEPASCSLFILDNDLIGAMQSQRQLLEKVWRDSLCRSTCLKCPYPGFFFFLCGLQ